MVKAMPAPNQKYVLSFLKKVFEFLKKWFGIVLDLFASNAWAKGNSSGVVAIGNDCKGSINSKCYLYYAGISSGLNSIKIIVMVVNTTFLTLP